MLGSIVGIHLWLILLKDPASVDLWITSTSTNRNVAITKTLAVIKLRAKKEELESIEYQGTIDG